MTKPVPFLALLMLPAMAVAAPFQDLAAVERAVVIAAGADIGAAGGPVAPIDRRLKLAECPKLTVDPILLNALTVRCPALGWRLRVPLAPGGTRGDAAGGGGVQTASYARPEPKPAPVIRRGDPVDLIAGSENFQVSTAATAQEDGAPGARIRVKSDGKNAIILAEVVGEGQVRIHGFN
jgi:flagella basal body P-ring formation protein FlgA